MNASPAADPLPTRRERQRRETVAEIKQRAWAELSHTGAAALSLREIARGMGMAPSALYRYFASRDDLLTELIVDGFDSLADSVEESYAQCQAAGYDAEQTFLTVSGAYRDWAFENRVEYTLIFSSSIPDYTGPERTKIAAMRSSDLLLRIMADCVGEGRLAEARASTFLTPELRTQLRGFQAMCGLDLSEEALAAAMWCYAALHGAVHLDMYNHLPPDLVQSRALFESTMRQVLASVGTAAPDGGATEVEANTAAR